jgi:hypothetical protein
VIETILEGTLFILILGLILSRAADFSTALGAIGTLYTNAVGTLAKVGQ